MYVSTNVIHFFVDAPPSIAGLLCARWVYSCSFFPLLNGQYCQRFRLPVMRVGWNVRGSFRKIFVLAPVEHGVPLFPLPLPRLVRSVPLLRSPPPPLNSPLSPGVFSLFPCTLSLLASLLQTRSFLLVACSTQKPPSFRSPILPLLLISVPLCSCAFSLGLSSRTLNVSPVFY